MNSKTVKESPLRSSPCFVLICFIVYALNFGLVLIVIAGCNRIMYIPLGSYSADNTLIKAFIVSAGFGCRLFLLVNIDDFAFLKRSGLSMKKMNSSFLQHIANTYKVSLLMSIMKARHLRYHHNQE